MKVDKREGRLYAFAILVAFAAPALLSFRSGEEWSTSALPDDPALPAPYAAIVETVVEAPVQKIVRARTEPVRVASVEAAMGSLGLGLSELAAKNPGLFGQRGLDAELSNALAGVASFDGNTIAAMKIASPRTLEGRRTDSVEATLSTTEEMRAPHPKLDGLEKTNVDGSKIRYGRALASSIDMKGVRRTIESHLAEARLCYDRASELEPGLYGVVRVEMTIDGDGRVENIALESSTADNESLKRCLASTIREWTFPRPNGARANVSYPLVFNRS